MVPGSVVSTPANGGWVYGTARIGTFYDLCRAGWLSGRGGLIIGRASFTAPPTRWQALRLLASPLTLILRIALRLLLGAFFRSGGNSLIRITNYVHLAVFGSNRIGKGVGSSCLFCGRIRGVRRHRPQRRELFEIGGPPQEHGHTILRLDPFGLCGPGGDALNPLGHDR